MANTDYTGKMILQPGTQDASLDKSNNPAQLTEVWKGPWAAMRDVFKTQKVKDFALVVGLKRPNFEGDADWVNEYPAPQVQDPVKYPWIVRAIDVKETVGDLGLLTLTYEAGTPQYDAGEDGKSDLKPLDVTDPDVQETTTWNITWGEYNRSMLDYSTIPEQQVKMKQYPTSEPWHYYEDSSESQRTEFPSDEKERLIQKYYAKDVSPRFHYPIITRRWELQIAQEQGTAPTIGADIDKKVAKPISFPFKLDAKWQFVQVSDNASWQFNKRQTIKVVDEESGESVDVTVTVYTYVRETSWQGALIWDDNFYGSSAWEPVKPNEEKK